VPEFSCLGARSLAEETSAGSHRFLSFRIEQIIKLFTPFIETWRHSCGSSFFHDGDRFLERRKNALSYASYLIFTCKIV
jgi:hypothetical protein